MTKSVESNAPVTPARTRTPFSTTPGPFGLYDPRFEHDGCGVSFVVDILGRPSRGIVADALDALCNLDHRGASGAEANTGDGAGILIQVPDRFLREVVDFALPPAGAYGVGLAFLPLDWEAMEKAMARVDAIVAEEGLRVLGWRTRPGRLLDDRSHGFRRAARRSASSSSTIPKAPPAWPSTASSSSPASAASTSSTAPTGWSSTSRRSRVARSSTRGCSPRRSWPSSSPTSPTSGSSRRWRWCTAGSRPTRSRRGRSRTRTATSRTTARSTPCRETATGCAPARR